MDTPPAIARARAPRVPANESEGHDAHVFYSQNMRITRCLVDMLLLLFFWSKTAPSLPAAKEPPSPPLATGGQPPTALQEYGASTLRVLFLPPVY